MVFWGRRNKIEEAENESNEILQVPQGVQDNPLLFSTTEGGLASEPPRPLESIGSSRLKTLHQNVLESFKKVKSDIETQMQWVTYLHQGHQEIKDKHESHVRETKEHIARLHRWVEFLQYNTQKHQRSMGELEQHVRNAVTNYNEHIVQLYNKYNELLTEAEKTKAMVHAKFSTHKEELSKQLREELNLEIQKVLKNVVELDLNHRELAISKRVKSQVEDAVKVELLDFVKGNIQENISKKFEEHKVTQQDQHHTQNHIHQNTHLSEQPVLVTYKSLAQEQERIDEHSPLQFLGQQHLTNPEKKLLSLLFNEADPLGYQQISTKTGHSINTVRVNMNLLKKKGFVEENALPNGVKLFNLKNKEKIKRMYSLEVMH